MESLESLKARLNYNVMAFNLASQSLDLAKAVVAHHEKKREQYALEVQALERAIKEVGG